MLIERKFISFKAVNDVYNGSNDLVVMVKNGTIKLEISANRPVSSYKFELCGIIGADPKTIILMNNKQTLKDYHVIKNNTNVNVKYQNINQRTSINYTLRKLLSHKTYSDLSIIAIHPTNPNLKEKFEVHKCILAYRCKYFEYSIESNESNSIELQCDPQTFKLVLNYIYSGNIYFNQDWRQTLDLITLSEKLLMDDLKILCEEALTGTLSIDNLLECLVSTHNIATGNLLKKELYNSFLRDFDKICSYYGRDTIEEQIMNKKGLFVDLFFFASGKSIRDKKKVSFVNQEPTVIENRVDNERTNGLGLSGVSSEVVSEAELNLEGADFESIQNSENFETDIMTEPSRDSNLHSETESNYN